MGRIVGSDGTEPPSQQPQGRYNLSKISFDDLGHQRTHRITRQGFPEAIYCPGKTTDQIVKIFTALCKGPGPVIATRVTPEVAQAIQKVHQAALSITLVVGT